MINITVDFQNDVVQIETKAYILTNIWNSDELKVLIKDILDKAYYSGEALCLEVKDKNGSYEEVDFWS